MDAVANLGESEFKFMVEKPSKGEESARSLLAVIESIRWGRESCNCTSVGDCEALEILVTGAEGEGSYWGGIVADLQKWGNRVGTARVPVSEWMDWRVWLSRSGCSMEGVIVGVSHWSIEDKLIALVVAILVVEFRLEYSERDGVVTVSVVARTKAVVKEVSVVEVVCSAVNWSDESGLGDVSGLAWE